ncbi:unnamed protein product [Bartonella apis]
MSLWVEVNDKMQYGYRYERVCEEGKNFSADFEPQLTPKQMLEMGVFGGKYIDRLQKRVSFKLVSEREIIA